MTGERDDLSAELRRALLREDRVDAQAVAALGSRLVTVFRQVLTDDAVVGTARLEALLGRDFGAAGDAAAEALGKWGGEAAVAILTAALAADPPKARRKVLKRAMHFAESAGQRIAADEAPSVVPTTRDAWMSAPTGPFGERLWVFRRSDAGSTPRMVTIAVVDAGLRDYAWRDGDAEAWRAMTTRLDGLGVRLAAVGWRWLLDRLARSVANSGAHDVALPSNWSVVASWLDLGSAAETPEAHPSQPSVNLLDLPEPPSPEAMHAVLELPETEEWLLPPDAFREHLERLRELGESKLVLDGLEPKQRVEALLREILDGQLASGDNAVWAERLLDLATVLDATDRSDVARTAALLATDVGSTERSPVGDAFLWTLATRTLAVLGGYPK